MQIPPTTADKFQLGGNTEPKTIVREVGVGTEANVTILYEQKAGEQYPTKMYVDNRDAAGNIPQVKQIVIRLN